MLAEPPNGTPAQGANGLGGGLGGAGLLNSRWRCLVPMTTGVRPTTAGDVDAASCASCPCSLQTWAPQEKGAEASMMCLGVVMREPQIPWQLQSAHPPGIRRRGGCGFIRALCALGRGHALRVKWLQVPRLLLWRLLQRELAARREFAGRDVHR